MSLKFMAVCWEIPLPATDKLILLALADNATDEGLAWPLKATIYRKTGVRAGAQKLAFKRLEAAGLLSRDLRNNTSTLYRLHIDAMVDAIPEARREPALRVVARSCADPGGSSNDRPRSSNDRPRSSNDRPRSSNDPRTSVLNPVPNPLLNLRKPEAQKALPDPRKPEAGSRNPEAGRSGEGGGGGSEFVVNRSSGERSANLRKLGEAVAAVSDGLSHRERCLMDNRGLPRVSRNPFP